jgi:hypothetical protein
MTYAAQQLGLEGERFPAAPKVVGNRPYWLTFASGGDEICGPST